MQAYWERIKIENNRQVPPAWQLRPRDQLEAESPTRLDGWSPAHEFSLRRGYCELIQESGKRLKMVQSGIATAIVICHRYFACRSMRRNDTFVIACASLFLGGKAEETPKSLHNVLRCMCMMRYGDSPRELERILAMQDELREAALLAERAVLYALGFELAVQHPYKIALDLAGQKIGLGLNRYTRPHPITDLFPLPQEIFNFTNASLQTLLCLQYRPEQVAAAVVVLSLRTLRAEVPPLHGRQWWQHCDVAEHEMEDIISQVLEVLDMDSMLKLSPMPGYQPLGEHALMQQQGPLQLPGPAQQQQQEQGPGADGGQPGQAACAAAAPSADARGAFANGHAAAASSEEQLGAGSDQHAGMSDGAEPQGCRQHAQQGTMPAGSHTIADEWPRPNGCVQTSA